MKNFVTERVERPDEVKNFHLVARLIYRDDPHWVQPLVCDIEHIFSINDNPLFTADGGGEAQRWLLRNGDGQLVGRIAAFYNKGKAAIESQPTGGCGFFECIDNQQAANTLFDTARDWLKERGMQAMDGSINFGDRMQWWGVLCEGYTMPLYAMNYNLPYYQSLFEGYGFGNYFNQITYRRTITPDIKLPDALYDKAERLFENPNYRFTNFDKKQVDKMADDFCSIYNRAWAKFDGVKPLHRQAAQKMIKSMMPIIDTDILYLTYHNDEPIGFFVMLPDINELIGKFHGHFSLFEKLRLLIGIKRKRINRIAGLIFGIVPEFQGHGVEAAMIRQLDLYTQKKRAEGREQYKTLEMGWIGDFNPVMMRMCESYVRAERYKRHVTYRYLFDRDKPFERCPRLGTKDVRRADQIKN